MKTNERSRLGQMSWVFGCVVLWAVAAYAASPDSENAALLYYQALLTHAAPDYVLTRSGQR